MAFQAFISSLKTGHLYKFISPKVHPTIPHFFILLGHTDNYDKFIFNCCTSKFDKRYAHLTRQGLPYSTLVPIGKDMRIALNFKLDDTCMDCNTPTLHTKGELENIFNLCSPIEVRGTLDDSHIQQILKGTHESEMVDEWMKDIVPKDIDNISPQLRVI